MRMELSHICVVMYVLVELFVIETVAQTFMTYCNVTVIVINYIYIYIYIYPPSREANMRSAGQYILCIFKIKG
jgi:hypothetical protein